MPPYPPDKQITRADPKGQLSGRLVALAAAHKSLDRRVPRSIFNQMVKYQTDPLSNVFSALADPTRRAILARLALGETTVGELAAPFEMSLPAISKHLRVLESAALIQREKDGRLRRCHLNAAPMKEAADWIWHYRRFWEARLDGLARYLENIEPRQHRENGDET